MKICRNFINIIYDSFIKKLEIIYIADLGKKKRI